MRKYNYRKKQEEELKQNAERLKEVMQKVGVTAENRLFKVIDGCVWMTKKEFYEICLAERYDKDGYYTKEEVIQIIDRDWLKVLKGDQKMKYFQFPIRPVIDGK